jgi:uncharacterized protein YjbI with pentapeptide repeats
MSTLVLGLVTMAPTPAQAACTDPPQPGVDWRQCNFDRFELSNINLTGAKLDRASFNRAVMQETKFADLDGARTRFINTDLRNTTFEGASLRYADFTEADLRGATLARSDLADARFVSADLRGADLTGARIRDADFFRANLSGATWVDGTRVCAENSISFCR